MEFILTLLAILFVCLGTFFSAVAVLGYFRLPDVFSRLHSTGKVGVFGVVLFLVAVALTETRSLGYALVLIFFLLAAGPATGHSIASAAYRMGLRPKNAKRDDLTKAEEARQTK